MKIFTVDFEDWFAPRNLPGFNKLNWDNCKLFIEKPADTILNILDEFNVKGIFFILGYIAERSPKLISKIAERGHEIASHGYSHKMIYEMSPQEFSEDIEKSLQILHKLGFDKIKGYRAPSFSITSQSYWALDILRNFGFEYSSSIYPTNLRKEYGIAGAEREIFKHENGLYEMPMNSAKFGKYLLPCSGGAYFRFYNYNFFRNLALRSLKETGHYVFYIHPWELAPEHPVVKTNLSGKLRHYYNISKVEHKLRELLSAMKFDNYTDMYGKFSRI